MQQLKNCIYKFLYWNCPFLTCLMKKVSFMSIKPSIAKNNFLKNNIIQRYIVKFIMQPIAL